MADVADDQDLERGEIRALRLAQGQHVEQALGGMRVAAVTGVEQRGVLPAAAASSATAPSAQCRTTNPRTPIASMFFSVSSAVSPLVVDEVEASKFRMSAPSRCAARWKLSRVRVEGSKNSVQIGRAHV